MNNSSAPPSGNPLPQGEKRKRSSEPPPPPPNVNKTAATRARIVEILASTANGCLSELGYYPGMPARMIELEKQNTTWKEENVKLFQDNRHLLTMVRHKSKQLELAGISDPEKVQKIMDFENEVHHLRLENEQLHNNSQVSQEALQNQVQYAQLLEDYRKLTESYRVAYSEVQRLTVDNQRLNAEVQFYKTLQPPQPPPQPPHPLQRSQSISHLKRSATFLPHVQPQLPMAPPQGGQPMVSPSSAVHPPPPSVQNVSQQGQRIDPLHHPQFFQNRHPPGSNPGSRRLSLNIPNPPIHVPSQGPNPVPQSVHFQQPQFGPSPQATFVPFPPPSDHQNVRRASVAGSNTYPVLPPQNLSAHDPNASRGNPYPVLQTALPIPVRRHSQPVVVPSSRTGSAPLPTRTSVANQPPEPHKPLPLSASSILSQASILPSQAPPLPSLPASIPSPIQPQQPPVQTISPQETYINPPNRPEVIPQSSPSFITSQASTSPGLVSSMSTFPENAPVMVDTKPAVAQTPSKQNNSPSSSEQDISMLQEAEEKPEIADIGLQQNIPAVGASSAESTPEMSASPDENQMQVDAVEDGGESEEEVELGPDGLRLVRDCLDQLFGESRVGQVVCLLCQARFAQKVVDQPPVPFVDPTDSQLEAHCVEEHQTVWDELRNPD